MSRPLVILGVPTSAGAYGPGQERAPRALRERGLVERLAASRQVSGAGDSVGSVFRGREAAAFENAAAVLRVASTLRAPVADALEAGADLLVLGGDCTIELGVVAGALRSTTSVGLVYVDLDADLTTGTTGDGVLDWMGVAHLLGLDDTHPGLRALGSRVPMLGAEDVVLVGLDRATDAEQSVIRERDIATEPLASVRDDVAGAVRRITDRFADRELVLVHVDADVLRRRDLRIADNDRDVDGLHPDELERLLVALMAMPNARALTLTEVNPDQADDEAAALDRLVGMLLAALARPAS